MGCQHTYNTHPRSGLCQRLFTTSSPPEASQLHDHRYSKRSQFRSDAAFHSSAFLRNVFQHGIAAHLRRHAAGTGARIFGKPGAGSAGRFDVCGSVWRVAAFLRAAWRPAGQVPGDRICNACMQCGQRNGRARRQPQHPVAGPGDGSAGRGSHHPAFHGLDRRRRQQRASSGNASPCRAGHHAWHCWRPAVRRSDNRHFRLALGVCVDDASFRRGGLPALCRLARTTCKSPRTCGCRAAAAARLCEAGAEHHHRALVAHCSHRRLY